MIVDVKRLAMLSRLKIQDEDKFEKQLAEIIDMVNQLPELTDENLVDPNNKMELRKDIATLEFTREDILCNAPQLEAGCIVVPRVVE